MLTLAARCGAGVLTMAAIVGAVAIEGFVPRLALVVAAVVGVAFAVIGRVPSWLVDLLGDVFGPDADPARQWPVTVGIVLSALAIMAAIGGVVFFAR